MKKVKHIFVTFLHSFIPQDIYYPKLLHTRFLFSFKYYILLMSFCALVITGVVVYQFSPQKMESYKDSAFYTLNSFPDDVKITVTQGRLESNQNKPLFLWVKQNGQPLFVFMIHTKEMLKRSSIPLPLIFLGSEKIQFFYKGNTMVRAYDPSLNLNISKSTLQQLIPFIDSYFPSFLIGFYIILVLLVPLSFISVVSVALLLSSVLVYILLKTFIPHIRLKKCVQAAFHGTHIPLFVTLLLYAMFPSASNILIISTSLIFVFSLVATYEMYSKKMISPPL